MLLKTTEMETALFLFGLGSIACAIIFLAMWVCRRSVRNTLAKWARQSTATAGTAATVTRSAGTREGGFRPMQDGSPDPRGGFRKAQDATNVPEEPTRQPNDAEEAGSMRCLGGPSKPAVDWLTGRALRPPGKENKT